MENLIIIISVVLAYILSVYLAYKWMQKVYYHEDGKWKSNEPGRDDIFMVLCPVVNMLFFMLDWRVPSKRKEITFFKPKEKENPSQEKKNY